MSVDLLATPPFPRLARMAADGRLPASLLFSGPPGAPVLDAAIRLVAVVNSEDRGPNSPATLRLEARVRNTLFPPAAPAGRGRARTASTPIAAPFPDVRLLAADHTRRIRVDPMRTALAAIRARPFEGRRRFLLIARAETMNPHAANALLKALEEPHPWLGVILTAAGEEGLLPTIVSRCQRWRFRGLTLGEAAAVLVERSGYEPEEAEAAAIAARSDPDRALELPRGERLASLRAEARRIARVVTSGIVPGERAALAARLAPAGARARGAIDSLAILLALLRAELRNAAANAAGAAPLDGPGASGAEPADPEGSIPPGVFAEALFAVEQTEQRILAFHGNLAMQLDGLLLAFNDIARPLVVARQRAAARAS